MERLQVAKNGKSGSGWGSMVFDFDRQTVHVGTRVVSASRAEFGLLHLLINQRNLPMTKEFIMSRLFGADHGRDLRQVDVFVARLRRALAAVGLDGLITTVGGRGYAVIDESETCRSSCPQLASLSC